MSERSERGRIERTGAKRTSQVSVSERPALEGQKR